MSCLALGLIFLGGCEVARLTFVGQVIFVQKISVWLSTVKTAMKCNDMTNRSSALALACKTFVEHLGDEAGYTAQVFEEFKGSLTVVSGLTFKASGDFKQHVDKIIGDLAGFVCKDFAGPLVGIACSVMQRLVDVLEGGHDKLKSISNLCCELVSLKVTVGPFGTEADGSVIDPTKADEESIRDVISQCSRVKSMIEDFEGMDEVLHKSSSSLIASVAEFINKHGKATLDMKLEGLTAQLGSLRAIAGGSKEGRDFMAHFKGNTDDWEEVLEFAKGTLMQIPPKELAGKISEVMQATLLCHVFFVSRVRHGQ